MSTRMHRTSVPSLQLPPEFEDLTGVVQNDLKVIVSILAERATERLLLSKRQSQQLRQVALEQPDRDDQQGPGAPLGGASLAPPAEGRTLHSQRNR